VFSHKNVDGLFTLVYDINLRLSFDLPDMETNKLENMSMVGSEGAKYTSLLTNA